MRTESEIKSLLSKDSQSLCSVIIIHRVLNSFKEEAKLCMIELMKRKANGDQFDFETYIDKEAAKYVINVNIPKVNDIKSKISSTITQAFFGDNLKNLTNSIVGNELDGLEDDDDDDDDDDDE